MRDIGDLIKENGAEAKKILQELPIIGVNFAALLYEPLTIDGSDNISDEDVKSLAENYDFSQPIVHVTDTTEGYLKTLHVLVLRVYLNGYGEMTIEGLVLDDVNNYVVRPHIETFPMEDVDPTDQNSLFWEIYDYMEREKEFEEQNK